jgi:Transcriptional regulator, AbiEi antitoxin, Type IV TA system
VKWIGPGHLGDVRAALKRRAKRNVILVARHMSPGARAALSEAGVSWADETGAAEIAIGTILVSRSGVREKKPHNIKHWTPAVIAIAEALLCGTNGTQAAMQAATGLSAGSCTNALRFLTDQELLTSAATRGPASARRLSEPRRLLGAYAAAVNDQPAGAKLLVGVTWQDILKGVAELGHRFDARKVVWAVTGGAAAAVIAPFLSSVSQATVYVEATSVAELKALAVSVKLRPIEGGRLTLKPFPSSAVQHLATLEDHDLRVAPWPRVYADLLREGVRGEEAAEHLYEVAHDRRNS